MTRRVPLPDDPTPREVAAVDRRHAAVQKAVTDLTASARHTIVGLDFDTTDVGVWVGFTAEDVLKAAIKLTDGNGSDAALSAAALGIAAEALLRLAASEAGR